MLRRREENPHWHHTRHTTTAFQTLTHGCATWKRGPPGAHPGLPPVPSGLPSTVVRVDWSHQASLWVLWVGVEGGGGAGGGRMWRMLEGFHHLKLWNVIERRKGGGVTIRTSSEAARLQLWKAMLGVCVCVLWCQDHQHALPSLSELLSESLLLE